VTMNMLWKFRLRKRPSASPRLKISFNLRFSTSDRCLWLLDAGRESQMGKTWKNLGTLPGLWGKWGVSAEVQERGSIDNALSFGF